MITKEIERFLMKKKINLKIKKLKKNDMQNKIKNTKNGKG